MVGENNIIKICLQKLDKYDEKNLKLFNKNE